MDKTSLLEYLRDAVIIAPSVQKHLDKDALLIAFSCVKTLEYFRANIAHMVRSVYDGHIGGDFVDLVGNLVTGQLRDAFVRTWQEQGGDGPIPDYLQTALAEMQQTQVDFDWIYQYYKDIIDARVNGTPVEPLIARSEMWANRYNEAVNEANRLIALETGGKLTWIVGPTEHCPTCQYLNGLTAWASEWDISRWKPQSEELACHGFRCQCELKPTDKRRSPKVLDTLMQAPR